MGVPAQLPGAEGRLAQMARIAFSVFQVGSHGVLVNLNRIEGARLREHRLGDH